MLCCLQEYPDCLVVYDLSGCVDEMIWRFCERIRLFSLSVDRRSQNSCTMNGVVE